MVEASVGFVPSLLGALAIALVGWLVARLLRAVARGLAAGLGVDGLAARLGVSEAMNRAFGPRSLAELLGEVLYWVVFAAFLIMAINTLGFVTVTATLERLLSFLPKVLGAAVILTLGLVAGGAVRSLVISGAALGTVAHGPRLGAAANLMVLGLAGVMAIEQLGVNTELLVALVTAVVGAVTLTMGASFALGARAVVEHVLAGHFLRERLLVGELIEVDGVRGVVERIGAVDTLLRDGEGSVSIPNSTLLRRAVHRQGGRPAADGASESRG
jgi:small-conductance mechanosensitive channel